MLSQHLIDSLFPPDLPGPEHWERRYPPRGLPAGAEVTRFSPSPTGFLHIGGVYTATINADIARHSGGDYLVRIEDTDQARIAEGAAEQFAEAFGYFGIGPDEDDATGGYGPYTQSAREQIYLSYVRELMRESLAYPCFETRQEAQDRAARQRAAGVPPGYYGQWAIWRDAPEERVAERLAAGAPYTVRFRSAGLAAQRVSFTDDIRGQLAMDDNRNDAVILKASDTRPRLPTYHFAHAVDDHLMRVTLVIRGAEWISSVPLHLQLFRALGFDQVRYAHIAPLMKQAGGSRRKLSKRHARGQRQLLHRAPIRLAELGTAGPLLDLVKLDDICADHVATLSGGQILDETTAWARRYDPELAAALESEPGLALRALAIEREGVTKWSAPWPPPSPTDTGRTATIGSTRSGVPP